MVECLKFFLQLNVDILLFLFVFFPELYFHEKFLQIARASIIFYLHVLPETPAIGIPDVLKGSQYITGRFKVN